MSIMSRSLVIISVKTLGYSQVHFFFLSNHVILIIGIFIKPGYLSLIIFINKNAFWAPFPQKYREMASPAEIDVL